MIEASNKMNTKSETPATFPKLFKEAGNTAVQAEDFKNYTGPWNDEFPEAQELGRMGQKNLCTGLLRLSEALFTGQLGWTSQHLADYTSEVIEEVQEVRYKTWLPIKICFGQRPA